LVIFCLDFVVLYVYLNICISFSHIYFTIYTLTYPHVYYGIYNSDNQVIVLSNRMGDVIISSFRFSLVEFFYLLLISIPLSSPCYLSISSYLNIPFCLWLHYASNLKIGTKIRCPTGTVAISQFPN